MLRRSACLGLAVTAALASAKMVRAEAPAVDLSSMPLYLDAAATPATPIDAALYSTPIGKPMEEARLKLTSYVEGGWTYNFDRPDNQTNTTYVFNFEDQDKQLDQLELFLSRSVDASNGKFDIGFNIEWIWGSDARLLHSNGLNFYGPINANIGLQDGPNEQFDLLQANVVLAIPVGSGITVTLGKFVTLLGYETINPTTNPFYSHSIQFGFGIPFTNTGGMAKYVFNDQWSATLGIVRGWEQSSNDNNGSPSGIGQIVFTPNDKMSLTMGAICGPEQNDDTSHYRTVVDVIGTYQVADNTKVAFDAVYGYGSRESNEIGFDGLAASGNWYGITCYFQQVLDPHFTFNARAEWFNDDDGCRGIDSTCYEVTLGVTIHPFPGTQWASGLMIRPEVRWDHSNDNIYNDGNDDNQFTAGGDIVWSF